jgi:hypothetical protein
MQTTLLWSASTMAFVTFVVHTFTGGVYVARPLLAGRGLPKAAKWLAYYCWHVVTMMLFAMGLTYAGAALGMLDRRAAGGVSAFAALCSLLSAGVAMKGGFAPWRFPSTSLFAATAALGFMALL